MATNNGNTPTNTPQQQHQKPTYLQMCVIHMDQHLADVRRLQSQATRLGHNAVAQQLADVAKKIQLAREELFLAQMSFGTAIHKLESME